jgi:hypothetical protein
MKTQITKILFALFIVCSTIACNKEDDSNTTTTDGLAPSASNTSNEQTLTMNVNGSSWVAVDDISGFMMTSGSNTVTNIIGEIPKTPEDSEDDDILSFSIAGPTTTGSYPLRTNNGVFSFLYNEKSYSFAYTSTATNKGRLTLEILNILPPNSFGAKYIAADFYGVAYNSYNANDSIIITNGRLRFR